MSRIRLVISIFMRAAGCIAVGVVISDGVAWGFEYRNAGQDRQLARYEESEATSYIWPLPTSDWPTWTSNHKDIPLYPDDVNVWHPDIGTRVIDCSAQSNGLLWCFNETQSGWPVRSATRFHVFYDEIRG